MYQPLPEKIIIQLLLIILFSFIIILNTLSILPGFQGSAHYEAGHQPDYQTVEETSEDCFDSCLVELGSDSPPEESLCGKTARRRGNHQKVVSFSFYGDMKHGYYQGIKENLALLEGLYPGWVYRLYLDSQAINTNTSVELCTVACNNKGFDLCPVNHLSQFPGLSSVFGMVWRFLPLSDPSVDMVVSRDLDSRLTEREVAAVSEWLDSGLAFHSMRDNLHHGVEILGGMWGARMDTGLREVLDTALRELVQDAAKHGWTKGLDQSLLTKWIWPKVAEDCLVHDSYLCKRFKSDHWRPWPTQRVTGPYNFVGAAGPMEIKTKCPKECRPPDHQDWTMC